MKQRHISFLALVISCVLLFTGTVSAETDVYHDYAMDLYSMGIFKGTDMGFELERVPTRLEGAVMFVRLLGGEEEAFAEDYSHPFNDVPDWGDPYIGYLYHYELTNGVSSDEFGTFLSIRAIEYVTFCLRALGYSDKAPDAQFSWNTSVNFADENDIFSDVLISELISMGFTRGHVAWVSYEILQADFNNETVELLDVLVSSGSLGINDAGSVFPEYNHGKRDVPAIGESWTSVEALNGSPTLDFPSRYGFEWHIFGMDYSNYIQVGEINGVVRAVLSASTGYGYEKDISIGMTKADVIYAYGHTGLTEIRKPLPDENSVIIYQLDNSDKATYVTDSGDYITYYYDITNNGIVAFLVIEKETEETTHDTFSNSGIIMEEGLDEQVYHITNAYRIQKGMDALAKNIAAAEIAKSHSENMVNNDFFSHTDPQGRGPGERALQREIPYLSLGENLAYGYKNSVDMVTGWLNSQTGHREVLLGNYEYIGIGVSIKDGKIMYCTQEYWR